MKKSLGILVLMGYAMSVGGAQAATYYVSKTGNDGNSCAQAVSTASPKQTIASGVACLAAGDTLIVRSGTYNEAFNNNVPSGTSWSNKVRIAAYSGETVWVTPQSGVGNGFVIAFEQSQQYIEFDGINLDASRQPYAAVKIESSSGNPHHIRIKNAELVGNPNETSFGVIVIAPKGGVIGGNEFINLKVHGGGQADFNHGFYMEVSDDLVEGCTIYDWPGAGIQVVNNFGYSPSGVILRNNVIRDLRSTSNGQRHWGIVIGSAAVGTLVYNNVIYNIPSNGASASGIDVYRGVNTQLYNNTLYGPSSQGIYIESGSTGTIVRNNISYANGGGDYIDYGSNTTASNNLFGSTPSFVNAAARNFRLLSDSPAINKGMTISSVNVDANGTPRPQGSAYDIGAYEFTSTVVTPTSPFGLHILTN